MCAAWLSCACLVFGFKLEWSPREKKTPVGPFQKNQRAILVQGSDHEILSKQEWIASPESALDGVESPFAIYHILFTLGTLIRC